MNLTRAQAERLKSEGAESITKPEPEPKPKADPLERVIRMLAGALDQVIQKLDNHKAPVVQVSPPQVNVAAPRLEAPNVTVEPKIEVKSARKWTFEITRDENGRISEITATAD